MKKAASILFVVGPMCLFAGNLGLGLIIGSPTGFSGKYLLGRQSAIEVNAGWSFWGSVGMHATGDYQHLFPGVVHDEYGKALETVIPYLGIGGRFKIRSTDNATNDDTEFAVGVRMGGGIEYLISQIGIFLELYPVVNIIPSTDFDFEGGLGARYYF
jgi:hypothetical protein